ncbi:hypothetical protein C8F01DRAFT_1103845 [Mycena amicta]|nr:hypothetical protein C8F01DRAFT_1103845 [Mycena amicta]
MMSVNARLTSTSIFSMGRRKIEIQPIIHERNRSVTFLKRKNGLFKKAYELGVLCSVDVAVIIFEQRPGHNVKLYQYCSGDVQDMVRRHINFDGEKDTRGPQDFSGNAAAKIDDNADPDEDDQEEEEEVVSSLGKRGRGDGSKDLKIDVEYRGQRPTPSSSSSLPLSRDRDSPSSKKTRLAPMMGAPSSGYTYAPPPSSMRNTAPGSSTYGGNSSYYPPISTPTSFSSGGYEPFGGSRGGRMYSDFRPPPPPARSGDPFSMLEPEETRQIQTPTTYGGLEWPVHSNSGRASTSGESSSPSTSGNWMELMGAGRVGRGVERERPGSRGRVVVEDVVKKEP